MAAWSGWLHCCVRAPCTALQCDAWAAKLLSLTIIAATAEVRKIIRLALKPGSAVTLTTRLCHVVVPVGLRNMSFWLQRLSQSLIEYIALAYSMAPPNYGRNGIRARDYAAQLKQSNITPADIASLALPPLLAIAGNLKLCEIQMECIDAADEANDPYREEDLHNRDALDQLMADLDLFIASIQEEIAPFVS